VDENDLIKLKLLANNRQDYINAVLQKLSNKHPGHEMSPWSIESGWINMIKNESGDTYHSYCSKCLFYLTVEYIKVKDSDDRVFIWPIDDIKCNR